MSWARSPFVGVGASALALGAAAVRWQLQGSGNLYSDVRKRLYLPDAVLGWKRAPVGHVWLGADALALLTGWLLAILALAVWLARRHKRGSASRALRLAHTALAVLPALIPVWAFASGGRSVGAVDTLPAQVVFAPSGLNGSLPAPAGVYRVAAHESSVVAATIQAGGETFEARFSDVEGSWRGDPADFAQPMTARVSVRAASIDTGVSLRSKHAREYLGASEYPEIVLSLERVHAVAQRDARTVEFSLDARLTAKGQDLLARARGTLTVLDADAQRALALPAGTWLLVRASLVFDLRHSALAKVAADFESHQLPIQTNLLLVYEP